MFLLRQRSGSQDGTVLKTYVLVDDALDLQRLHHVGDELRVGVGVPDLLVEQSSDAALWADTPTLNQSLNSSSFYSNLPDPSP